jgi:hypothetical protein
VVNNSKIISKLVSKEGGIGGCKDKRVVRQGQLEWGKGTSS